MKVLHVTHGYYPENSGGIEAYVRMVADAQRERGDEIRVLTGSIEPRERCQIETYEFEGVSVFRLHRDDWYNDHYAHSYHPEAARMVRELFAAERPDVLHVHQWIRLTSDLVAIARELEIATVVTLHDVYTSCPRAFRVDRDEQPCDRELSIESCKSCVPRFGHESEHEVEQGIELFRDQYRAELAAAGRVLVAAGTTADLLSRTTGAERGLFTVHDLPYRPRFEGLPRPNGQGPIRFAYWGSLTAHKGPHLLLEAFRAVVARIDAPAELHLFGPLAADAVRVRLEGLAADLPVTFHGPFEAEHLAAADLDVAVFPVLCFEGFGLGLAEAFELGLPAIVSDIGALSDRVGNAGIKVPPGDVSALTEAMVSLAADRAARERLAAEIPPPPIGPTEHVAELREHYEAAIATGRSQSPGIDAERRAEFILVQRESSRRALRDATGRRDPN